MNNLMGMIGKKEGGIKEQEVGIQFQEKKNEREEMDVFFGQVGRVMVGREKKKGTRGGNEEWVEYGHGRQKGNQENHGDRPGNGEDGG